MQYRQRSLDILKIRWVMIYLRDKLYMTLLHPQSTCLHYTDLVRLLLQVHNNQQWLTYRYPCRQNLGIYQQGSSYTPWHHFLQLLIQQRKACTQMHRYLQLSFQ